MKKIIITITAALLLTTACSNTSETPVSAAPKYQTYVNLGQKLPITDVISIDKKKLIYMKKANVN